jgi:hypothetical protein
MANEAGNEKGARCGRRPEKPPELPNLARKLRMVVRHEFPEFGNWLGNVPDPRNALRIYYPLKTLLWTTILAFICGARSRRDFRAKSATAEFLANSNWQLDSSDAAVPHPDTLVYLLKRLKSQELATLPVGCVHTLMRNRVLDESRLEGHYLVAIDGTGILSSSKKHCDACLTQVHKNGTTTYHHMVLEAKLVTPGGLAFSVGTEFVENAKPKATKQDCELRALYRLLPRLKERFPRARICLLLDSLYANDPVLKLCEKYGWKYTITFKEGSAPAAYADFQTLRRLQNGNRLTIDRGEEMQQIEWVNGLVWEKHRCNVLRCKVSRRNGVTTDFVWLTNFDLHPRNVEAVANYGGRCRWKIENEGFNAQKNGEFHIEHPFGRQGEAWKNFYLLAQVAHLLLQLMYWWRALRAAREYLGAVYRFIAKIAEHMRTQMPPDEAMLQPAFQLRLDTT